MRSLHGVGLGVAVIATFVGCRAGLPTQSLPWTTQAGSETRFAETCAQSGGNLTVRVRVPVQSGIGKIAITDSIYGVAVQQCTLTVASQCADRICAAHFSAPATINDVVIDGYKGAETTAAESGDFPAPVPTTATAVLGGAIEAIKKIAVQPFLSLNSTSSSAPSTLPVGQAENVWVVASNDDGVIIGTYKPEITIDPQNLTASATTLQSSSDGEKLRIWWQDPLGVSPSPGGSITASISSKISSTAKIEPGSGIVYYQPGPNNANLAPGPVATHGDGVYFVINDASGCDRAPCKGSLDEFDTSSKKFSSVPFTTVPGISQLYFTNDGALWMAAYQPVGVWKYALPILRMSPGPLLSTPSPLPPSFGEGSGFVQDGSGHLWISGCLGTRCTQNHNGEPVLMETAVGGFPSAPPKIVKLPLTQKCAKFGYLGFTVGDVAYSGATLYVIGLNDGSAPPARGTIWTYKPGAAPSCVSVPPNFNPSAYFATLGGDALVVGAGGNALDYRWAPDNGFYDLNGGKLVSPAPDMTPHVTANHLSQHDGVVYYVHQDNLSSGVNVSGLGTYLPETGEWNVFPSASFQGPQSNDGVVAEENGAWFTAANVCSSPPPAKPWNGVCLGRVRYLSTWGISPSQYGNDGLHLPTIQVNAGTAFGPITGPNTGSFEASPVPAKGGPCTVQSPPKKNSLTFSVVGVKPGVCVIVLKQKSGSRFNSVRGQNVHSGPGPLVTRVTSAAPR